MLKKIKNLLNKADAAYYRYKSKCDDVCIEAQKYADWGKLRWEHLPGDGLCFGIQDEVPVNDICHQVIDDLTLVPAYAFFNIVEIKGVVTPEDFFYAKI